MLTVKFFYKVTCVSSLERTGPLCSSWGGRLRDKFKGSLHKRLKYERRGDPTVRKLRMLDSSMSGLSSRSGLDHYDKTLPVPLSHSRSVK